MEWNVRLTVEICRKIKDLLGNVERIDIHYRRECEIKIGELKANFNKMSIEIEKKEKELRQQEQAANVSSYTPEPSDDESLPEEDCVQEENFKIYSNPLFEFDDEYISSDVNPLFNEPDLLVTPLSKLNEDECFDPGGIDDANFDPEGDVVLLKKLLNDDPSSLFPSKELNFEELKVIKYDVSTNFEDDYHDSEGDIIYLESLLIKETILNLPPEVFLDRGPRSLEDEPDKDDLKNIVKVFDPGIHEKIISPICEIIL
ncbi:hypothetical protein Tco_0822440 [Tanacetum coccineum]|uniref:Reverse transcriptase domain-containing protein n=1 Tax=Tanacetum coccineum TaxID=301880 RepID=A0ABQ5AG62_9ASTR